MAQKLLHVDVDLAALAAEVDLLLSDLGETPPIRALEPTVATAASDELASTHVAVGSAPVVAGRPVLVVDSVAIARKFLVHRLRALGYDVHGAESGDRALAMVERRSYAIVFLELTLEGAIDGLGLCQAIKQAPQPPGGSAPAVVFTAGNSASINRVRGSLAGCDAYLNKPLLENDLVAALRDVDPLFA